MKAAAGKPRPVAKGVRAKRPPLSATDVVSAAFALIDQVGVEGFTMRALADAMGVYPTALYWHAGSKSLLLAAVSARLFDEVVLPDEHQMEWDEWLTEVAFLCRAVLHRHPEIARIAGSFMVVAPTAMPMVERIVGVLERAGFTGAGLVQTYNALLGFVLGWTTLELSAEPSGVDQSWKADFSRQLAALDPNSYPALSRNMALLENSAFMIRYDSGRSRPMGSSFKAALEVLLAGLRATTCTQADSSSKSSNSPNATPSGGEGQTG